MDQDAVAAALLKYIREDIGGDEVAGKVFTVTTMLEYVLDDAKELRRELQFLRDERSQYWPLLNDLKQFNRDKQYTAEFAAKVKEDLRELDALKEYKEDAERYERLKRKVCKLLGDIEDEDD